MESSCLEFPSGQNNWEYAGSSDISQGREGCIVVRNSAEAPVEDDGSGDDSGIEKWVRAVFRKRTKLRGRVKARSDLGGSGSPSADAPYENATMARSECLTPKNGPWEVARRRGVPNHSNLKGSTFLRW